MSGRRLGRAQMTRCFAVNIPSRGLSRATHVIRAVWVIDRIICTEKGRIVILDDGGRGGGSCLLKRTDGVRSVAA